MQVVHFTLSPDIPADRRRSVIAEISSWPEVLKASCLDPDSDDAEVARMCHAYVKEGSTADALLARLKSHPPIASASIPAERRLIR